MNYIENTEYQSSLLNSWVVNECYYADNCSNGEINVRANESLNSQILGVWPSHRLAVVQYTGNNEWFKCYWRQNQVGYVLRIQNNNELLNNFRIITKGERGVLLDVAAHEPTTNPHLKYYYKYNEDDDNINWCHHFADWLACHCGGISGSLRYVPNEANCKEGVIAFLKSEMFVFVNARHKAEVYDNADRMDLFIDAFAGGRNLTQTEQSYEPQAGDYVYFRDYDNNPGCDTAYHVGVILGYTKSGNQITIRYVEGNATEDRIVRITTKAPSSNLRYNESVLGFGLVYGNG